MQRAINTSPSSVWASDGEVSCCTHYPQPCTAPTKGQTYGNSKFSDGQSAPFFFSFVFFFHLLTRPRRHVKNVASENKNATAKLPANPAKSKNSLASTVKCNPPSMSCPPSPPPYLVTLSQQYDQQPNRKDNSMERLASLVESFGKSMEELNHRLDVMNSTLHRMEKRLTRCWHCAGTVDLETGDCLDCNQASSCRMMNPM